MEKKDEFKVANIGFFKKMWLSITKFERYPEMAAEGVGKAFSYLAKLMLIFCVIISIATTIDFKQNINEEIKYLDENISEINYKDGILEIQPKDAETMQVEIDNGTVIVDTKTENDEKIREYEQNIKENDLGILWLNNKLILYTDGVEEAYYYGDILEGFEITEFNKTDLIDLLSNNTSLYIVYFFAVLISSFVVYFIATLLDILVLSLFGLLTSYLAGIKIRYRAVFNMSVYALTISIILKMLYILVSMFTDFTIKYFDFMYSAIGYICLVASIFMIKSDVIKQQMELIKIREEKKKNAEEEEKEEEQKKEEKKEDEKEKNKEEPEAQEEETEGTDGTEESEGSNA